MKTKFYLAGKIGKNDWRHRIIPGLREASAGCLDCGSFVYTGPFFTSCDHGCQHGPNTHGVGLTPKEWCEPDPQMTPHQIWTRNHEAVRCSNGVFAYIDANDAYGTLVELGWAQEGSIPRWVLFGPNADPRQMWYSTQGATRVMRGVYEEELEGLFDDFIRLLLNRMRWSRQRGGAS